MSSEDATKYAAAYEKLKRISEKLQEKTENVDVDELLEDVREAANAFKICKDRIEVATRGLDEAFKEVPEVDVLNEDEVR